MERRKFLKTAGLAAAATGALGLSTSANAAQESIKWKMVTAWPKNFPGLGTGAEFLAQTINDMSGGRIEVKVYAAGELVPPFEVFDAVSRGTAQMGHASPLYWAGKVPAAQFFGGVPFGLTGLEINAWLYYGGGMELWQELYKPFGVVPAAVGNSTVQMAGWFNREIKSVADLKGMKMRIAGYMGGEVYRRAGATPVSISGGENFA
ncbi:MAG: twin-arginine translocation signal domain-containing protein, partial [Gammaproteobacteria bacterium]|nr:twin-arginine translocation signal domain-containing protein [Gammaproteobacteria bacterium]